MSNVPTLLTEVARTWRLTLLGYHDAGHASALALAITDSENPVLLKAWYDRVRYAHETAALRHWAPVNGAIVQAQHDHTAVACLKLVGNAPGGQQRPPHEERLVADRLVSLHQRPPPGHGFPTLEDHLEGVQRRIRRRLSDSGEQLPSRCIELGVAALERRAATSPQTLLHADLYRENIVFGGDVPVFIDPLPTLGDPAFDWAFWVVYFDLRRDPVVRLCSAAEVSGITVTELVPWCLLLCLDGLLYYHEVSDLRERRMIEVMAMLAAAGDQSR